MVAAVFAAGCGAGDEAQDATLADVSGARVAIKDVGACITEGLASSGCESGRQWSRPSRILEMDGFLLIESLSRNEGKKGEESSNGGRSDSIVSCDVLVCGSWP